MVLLLIVALFPATVFAVIAGLLVFRNSQKLQNHRGSLIAGYVGLVLTVLVTPVVSMWFLPNILPGLFAKRDPTHISFNPEVSAWAIVSVVLFVVGLVVAYYSGRVPASSAKQ
ncbi:MAG: hypothetical protein WBP26_03390 [Candidatus Saccharimonadales bacterium]